MKSTKTKRMDSCQSCMVCKKTHMGTWAHENMGMWVYGHMGIWAHGHAHTGIRAYGHGAYGHEGIWANSKNIGKGVYQ